ncbi:MAG: hypothetical protein KBS94_07885 [Prevotella sp.]|nr:hypothetical protein [Candidatus Equicola faecalis]
MKKIFTLFVALFAVIVYANADVTTEKYLAIDENGVYAPEFAAVTDPATFIATNAQDGMSKVSFGTANMVCEAVGGTTPKNVPTTEDGEFQGWTEGWNDVQWKNGNQGDIAFRYINGTGNPALEIGHQKKESQSDGWIFEPTYKYYQGDGALGLPVMGLYYKFTPKVDGALKIQVWANKGNRRTFWVTDSDKKAKAYKAEGYINGQNDADGKKRWLTSEEIDSIHNTAGEKEPDDAYIIGAGNQAFWGNILVDVKAGETYWLFQHSSQVGFQGYTFTPGGTSGIEDIIVEKSTAVEKKADNRMFNLQGVQVDKNYKGVVIMNGKRFLQR